MRYEGLLPQVHDPSLTLKLVRLFTFGELARVRRGRLHQHTGMDQLEVMLDQPSTVWVAYQGKQVKASPERVRRAGEEEQLTLTGWIDDLVHARGLFEKTPKRGFLDITLDPLLPEEEFQIVDQDSDYEPSIAATEDLAQQRPDPERVQWQGPLQPVGRRLRQTTMVREDENLPIEPMDDEPLPQERADLPGDGPPEDPPQEELQPEEERQAAEKRTYDDEDHEGPVSKRSRVEYLEIFELKVANLLKVKQSKEIQFQELSKFNKECFSRAMKK